MRCYSRLQVSRISWKTVLDSTEEGRCFLQCKGTFAVAAFDVSRRRCYFRPIRALFAPNLLPDVEKASVPRTARAVMLDKLQLLGMLLVV